MTRPTWQQALRVFAVLIAARALTNVGKLALPDSVIVAAGRIYSGGAKDLLAALLAVYMLVYAYGMWTLRRYALPMAVGYAIFVAVNIAGFALLHTIPPGVGYLAAGLAFVVVGVGVTTAAAWLLYRHRDELS